MSYVDELNDRVMLELTEILLHCSACEFQVRELFKVANCVFARDEFFALITAFTKFKNNIKNLEDFLYQVDSQVSMLQILTIKSMASSLQTDFAELTEMLVVADKRIDDDKIDFDAANMLNELIEKMDYDIVDFDGFNVAMTNRFYVAYLVNPNDEDYDSQYGELSVLRLASFKSKREAYIYALRNGISRDMVNGL